MRQIAFTLAALVGLIVLPAMSGLQNILLAREAVTAAHVQSVAQAHGHHHHDQHSENAAHTHRHRHSPAEPEHEHQQLDPSLLSSMVCAPSLGVDATSRLGFDRPQARNALASDQIPFSLTFASPLRPPIA
jgi:ABC-type Zn2+ transport system substrate-binding protein/surface adhesin